MNKLYVIHQVYTSEGYATEIDEVNIVKETAKQFTISNKQVYRSTVNKADLNKLVGSDSYLFTYDLELGTKIWNEHYTKKAENLRKMMETALGYII